MSDYDPRIVDLYDADNPAGPDHAFYRELARARRAHQILDVGCGTGLLAAALAKDGHDVLGLDPSPSMLAYARRRPGGGGVRWVEGDTSSLHGTGFDLALLTGNVPQHIADGEWERTLADLQARLRPGGTLAFETRNPEAREWEHWATDEHTRRDTLHGPLEEWMRVEVVDARTIRFEAFNTFAASNETVVEAQTLLFRPREEIERQLAAARFDVEQVYGTWASQPLATGDPIMIFVATAR